MLSLPTDSVIQVYFAPKKSFVIVMYQLVLVPSFGTGTEVRYQYETWSSYTEEIIY